MSTEINIKKKLAILNEGANVTTDASSIDFVGSGVNASSVDGNVTVTIPGGSGTTTYYLNQTVTQAPYKEFSSVATAAAEQVVPLTVSAGATSVIAEFQTPTGVPNTTQIPGGLWQLFLHFNAGAVGQNWIIRPTVYKRDLGGIETLLFTPDPEIVTNMSTTTTMYVSDGVFPATTLLTTDRIVVRISVENTTGVSQTVNFRTEGSQHYSVALTTLNQVISGGSVTSVTGTAPIVSSGGTTPAISIAQATGSTDGYLSSTDWTVFNGKQNAITLTTTGTSGASTLVGSTLNIPQYAGGLTYFTEAQSTAAPNTTVAVDSLTAVASTTDADFAILAKGNGAILASIPNSIAVVPNVGGNKRGQYALDLQHYGQINVNTEVASGNYAAIVAGSRNTASGASSTVVNGLRNTASANDSFVGSGYLNTASGLYSFIGAGQSNIASTTYSMVIGGYNNQSTGGYAISGGGSNIASGSRAVALGESNTASGSYSVSLNSTNTASSDYSNARGLSANTGTTWGKWAIGGGGATLGSSQKGLLVQTTRTTGNTPTEIAFQGGGVDLRAQMTCADNMGMRVKGSVIGKQSGSTNIAAWDFDYVIVRGVGVGTTAIVGTPTISVVTNIPAWGNPTITADTARGYASLKVIGAAATNIHWTATIESTEVIYA